MVCLLAISITMSMTINISYQYRLHYETDSGYGDEHRDTV